MSSKRSYRKKSASRRTRSKSKKGYKRYKSKKLYKSKSGVNAFSLRNSLDNTISRIYNISDKIKASRSKGKNVKKLKSSLAKAKKSLKKLQKKYVKSFGGSPPGLTRVDRRRSRANKKSRSNRK